MYFGLLGGGVFSLILFRSFFLCTNCCLTSLTSYSGFCLIFRFCFVESFRKQYLFSVVFVTDHLHWPLFFFSCSPYLIVTVVEKILFFCHSSSAYVSDTLCIRWQVSGCQRARVDSCILDASFILQCWLSPAFTSSMKHKAEGECVE